MRRILLAAVVLAALAGREPATGSVFSDGVVRVDYYVNASTGNDSNSGTQAAPWQTLQGAATGLRGKGVLTSGTFNDIVVNVAAGDYGTLALTNADKATGRRVRWRCSGGIDSCGMGTANVAVTGWVVDSGAVYKTHVSACPQSLFENGVRARKARFPNYVSDGTRTLAQATYLATEGVNNSSTVLQYVNGNLSPGAWNLADAQIVIHSGGPSIDYSLDIVPISSLNLGARQFTLARPTRYVIYSGGAGARYFVQGVRDLLDQAGEFHCESATGTLYYQPRSTPIASQNIVAPAAEDVLTIIGSAQDSSHVVTNIGFEGGWYIAYSDLDPAGYTHAYPNDGDSGEGHFYPGYDRQYSRPLERHGTVRLENVDHVTFDRVHIAHSGTHGVFARQWVQGVSITNSLIDDTGVDGLYIDGNYPHEGDVSGNNAILNVRATNCGAVSIWGGCFVLANTHGNLVGHIEASNSTRAFISLYTYVGIAKTDNYARNNRISYFKFSQGMWDTLDGGGLYTAMLSDDDTCNGINYWSQGTIDQVNAHASVPLTSQNGVYVDGYAPCQVFDTIKPTNIAGSYLTISPNSDGGTYTNLSPSATVSADVGVTVDFPNFTRTQ